MVEQFDEIFWAVGDEHDCDAWWQVFDSPLFDEVADRIAAQFGEEIWDTPEYLEWVHTMAGDL